MREYPKIHSIFKRDEHTHKFRLGEWSLPEFGYLADNQWEMTEKVDGTNIRVGWRDGITVSKDGPLIGVGVPDKVVFAGRTASAQMYTPLIARLQELFPPDKLKALYPDLTITLYCEGYGARIQKGGGNYKTDGVDIVLFDAMVDNRWWLDRENVCDVAAKVGIATVPIVMTGTLNKAIEVMSENPPKSTWGDFTLEGFVCKPTAQLFDKRGERIITKLKVRDFA